MTSRKTKSLLVPAVLLVLFAGTVSAETQRVDHNTSDSSSSFIDSLLAGEGMDMDLEGEIEKGNDVILTVSDDGEAVQDATVWMNSGEVGHTDSSGEINLTVPDAAVMRVKAEKDGSRGYLRRNLY